MSRRAGVKQPRWDTEGEPENLEAASADALLWLQYFAQQSRNAGNKALAASREALKRFLPKEYHGGPGGKR